MLHKLENNSTECQSSIDTEQRSDQYNYTTTRDPCRHLLRNEDCCCALQTCIDISTSAMQIRMTMLTMPRPMHTL